MDIRLSLIDETDIGLYPVLSKINYNNNEIPVLDYAIPKWSVESNINPTIVHFEELNRASLSVRNAALQILLERGIGTNFKFNDNVLMIASGNLGEEDGTEVEIFDSALNNRLIHKKHNLTTQEWLDDFATIDTNIHPIIIDYIKTYPEELFKLPNENQAAYATPRSWTFLSDYIIKNYGINLDNTDNWLLDLKSIGSSYIGASIAKFIKFCENSKYFTVDDILNKYNIIEKQIKGSSRDKISELLFKIKEDIKIENLTDTQIDNLIKFFKILSDDEFASVLLKIIEKADCNTIKSSNNYTKLKNSFKDHFTKLFNVL